MHLSNVFSLSPNDGADFDDVERIGIDGMIESNNLPQKIGLGSG